MYVTAKRIGVGAFLRSEALPAGLAWLIAEGFYKFGSFTLELAAFALTWTALSWVAGIFSSTRE